MNLEVLNLLLTAALLVYIVIFSRRCWHRLEAIARSVEALPRKGVEAMNNIIRFRRPGAPRSVAIVSDDELEAYRCKLRGKGEA